MTLDKSKWKGQPMTPYSDEWQGIKPVTHKVVPNVGNCARCGSYTKLTNDHIIPLAILKAMGMSNNENFNIQRLCVKCNSHKASQLDPKNPPHPTTHAVLPRPLE